MKYILFLNYIKTSIKIRKKETIKKDKNCYNILYIFAKKVIFQSIFITHVENGGE